MLRIAVVWLLTGAVFVLLGWLLPGVVLTSPAAALAAAALLGLINALVWPVFAYLALPLAVLTLGMAAIVLNGVAVAFVAYLLPGLEVHGLGTAIGVALVLAVANTILTSLLALDDEDVYYRRIIRRAARRVRPEGATDIPGVLFIQIDGLGLAVLRRALRDGNAPTLARWVASGSHRLLGWETGWSSQTGASQCGILHGSTFDIPAFRWLEKETGARLVCNHPSSAAEIERRHSDGRGLLHADGVGRGNLYTGDAEQNILTMSVAGRKRGRVGQGYYGYFAVPYNAIRTLAGFGAEVVRELVQASRQRRNDIRPRVRRGGLYPFLRAFATVITRDVTTQTLIGDLYAGRSVMYADFVGYDEVAHHSGPERYDALDTLRRLDRDLGRLERAAANAPRPYRFVVLSDHGQSQGSTFEDRYGCSLGELVRAAMQEGAVTEIGAARVAGQESWGYAGAAAADVTSEDSRVGRALQRALRDRRETGPRRALPAAGTVPGEAVVLASGNLGLVYLTERPGRWSLEEIGQRYPQSDSGPRRPSRRRVHPRPIRRGRPGRHRPGRPPSAGDADRARQGSAGAVWRIGPLAGPADGLVPALRRHHGQLDVGSADRGGGGLRAPGGVARRTRRRADPPLRPVPTRPACPGRPDPGRGRTPPGVPRVAGPPRPRSLRRARISL